MYQPSSLINFLIALAAAPLLVTASPFHLPRSFQNVPQGAHALAFDPESGAVSAYGGDGAFLGKINHTTTSKRTDGTCSNLSPADLKAPCLRHRRRLIGAKGSTPLRLTLPNQGNYPAIACVSDDTAIVTVQGNPSCATSDQTSSGNWSALVVIKLPEHTTTFSTALEGTSSSATITTTKTSGWSLGLTVAATIGIPDIVDAVTTTSNNQQTQTIAMEAADGQTCSLVFTSTSCTGSGKGSIVMTATGWAWFEYSSKVHGHYYWALNIETYIPDASQRSNSIDFTAAISATNDSKYQGTCNINDSLKTLRISNAVAYCTASEDATESRVVGIFCSIHSQMTVPEYPDIQLLMAPYLGRNLDIRTYETIPSGTQISIPTSQEKHFMVFNGMTPNERAEQTFNDWYTEEHIPMLSAVPGWRSSRRFQLISASTNPPRYLALHEWHNRDAFGTPEFKAATNTSWRTRVVVEQVNKKERHLLEYLGTVEEVGFQAKLSRFLLRSERPSKNQALTRSLFGHVLIIGIRFYAENQFYPASAFPNCFCTSFPTGIAEEGQAGSSFRPFNFSTFFQWCGVDPLVMLPVVV
ncbi:hypothetical protein C8F04DRAFT_1184096 [Mycena alexandri]|uniref:Uncharacterized protein n=1 Tax=Mycena alexandri TaxID=1745969 RepID=A0AAD6ST07_9AGAR|nr:hypothetical protein C8F04DRAFT_1184096 [Mycena alexandri]